MTQKKARVSGWAGHDTGPDTHQLEHGPWTFSFLADKSGRWVLAGIHVENPAAGITSAMMRSAPIEMAWRIFRSRIIAPAPGGGWSVSIGPRPGFAPPKPRKRRGPDGREWTDQKLLDLAAEYSALCKVDRTPTATLAKRRHLEPGRVRALISRARQRDYLTKTTPGQAGGELTGKAIELLEERLI